MSGFCLETKRERGASSRTRDRGSGGASNQGLVCVWKVVCARTTVCSCVTASNAREALCRASRLKLCKQVTMSKLNLRTLTHKHTQAPRKVTLKDKGVGGVLAVGGSKKQIMINWLTFLQNAGLNAPRLAAPASPTPRPL